MFCCLFFRSFSLYLFKLEINQPVIKLFLLFYLVLLYQLVAVLEVLPSLIQLAINLWFHFGDFVYKFVKLQIEKLDNRKRNSFLEQSLWEGSVESKSANFYLPKGLTPSTSWTKWEPSWATTSIAFFGAACLQFQHDSKLGINLEFH